MGNKNKYKNKQPASSSPQVNATVVTRAEEPLAVDQAENLERLQSAKEEVAEAQQIDPTALEQVPPPPGVPVQRALKNAWEAERVFRLAQKKADEAAQQVERSRQEVQKQRQELDRKRTDLDTQETKLIERELAVDEREREAERGFLSQRRRVVADLEEQTQKLRAERDAETAKVADQRSTEEAAWRRRQDQRAEQWQKEEGERTARWLREDEERAAALSTERSQLLRELAEERQRAQAEWQKEGATHRARILADEQDLAKRRAEIDAVEKQIRMSRRDLDVDRDLLDEDKQALEKKVARVAAERVASLEADLHAERERLSAVQAERDRYFRELESRRELDRKLGARTPEEVLDRLRTLEVESADLRQKLHGSLGEDSRRRLTELEGERSAWLEERGNLTQQVIEGRAHINRLRIGATELESLREHRDTLKAQNELLGQALKDLRAEVKQFTEADRNRNPLEALVTLDQDSTLRMDRKTGPLQSPLSTFATELRHRIVHSLPGRSLFYGDRDVRCFLGGLAMSRLLLLQGISGTGKTSLPLAFSQAIGTPATVVSVQAGWRDRQDLIGYYNAFHRHYYAQNFLQALYRAGTPAFKDRPFLIVLDEINLSRVEQFFADFLSAMEQPEGQRQLTLLDDSITPAPALMIEGRHLPIPPNVWFVGTANHDETTTEFADKTYDRAHIMELPRRDPAQIFQPERLHPYADPLSYRSLLDAFQAARKKQAGHVKKAIEWLGTPDAIAALLEKRFRVGWGNRLERDVEQFVPVVIEAGGTLGEAMDHLLATKVLRKLRDRHDVRAAWLDDLKKKLESSWGPLGGSPERCLALLDRELSAKRSEEDEA